MIRSVITAFVLFAMLGVDSAQAQTAQFKRFVPFKQIVTGVDFYASNRQTIAPYEKPVAETIVRLRGLFGTDLPKGAIFVCSSLEQKDSIYEPMILKQGYNWMLSANTPEVAIQERLARMKAQMGGQLPAEILDRIKNRPPEMVADAERQQVTTVTQQVAYAVMQTMLDKDLRYRSSRVDDMGKSPLPDWLDIGIASYASGTLYNLTYLQQHMDQTFPIEDLIAMARPFMASSSNQSGGGGGGRSGGGGNPEQGGANGGGGGMPQGGFGQGGMPPGGFGQGGMPPGGFGQGGSSQGGFSGRGAGGGGFGGNGGQRGGGQRTIPKDEQDRMLFDGQASTLFSFLMEKIGVEKMKLLVKQAVEGKESREFITRPDALGPDFEKIEDDWTAWVKALNAPPTQRQ